MLRSVLPFTVSTTGPFLTKDHPSVMPSPRITTRNLVLNALKSEPKRVMSSDVLCLPHFYKSLEQLPAIKEAQNSIFFGNNQSCALSECSNISQRSTSVNVFDQNCS